VKASSVESAVCVPTVWYSESSFSLGGVVGCGFVLWGAGVVQLLMFMVVVCCALLLMLLWVVSSCSLGMFEWCDCVMCIGWDMLSSFPSFFLPFVVCQSAYCLRIFVVRSHCLMWSHPWLREVIVYVVFFFFLCSAYHIVLALSALCRVLDE
jgi:hypothetical protein